ncbi:MAG: PAS domain S-box protein [Verrucomicrobia bacterium]|nr:PAS domain S-box protein [Verrucomicrobiota bacterium]
MSHSVYDGSVSRQAEPLPALQPGLHSSVAAVFVLDADFVIKSESRGAAEIFGYDPGSRVGEHWLGLVHPEDRAEAQRRFERLAATPGGTEIAVFRWARAATDEWSWMHADGTNLLHDPSVGGVILIGVNVTDRVLAEERARAGEHRLRSLVEHSSDAILIITRAGIVTYASESTSHVFGWPSHEFGLPAETVVGRNALKLVHREDRKAMADLLEGLAEFGGVITEECRIRDSEGHLRWIEISAVNRLDDPHVAGIVLNARDVSARRAFEVGLAVRDRLLATEAAVQRILLARPRVREHLPEILGLLGRSAGVSRALLLEYPPDHTHPPRIVAEWAAPGVEPRIPRGEESVQAFSLPAWRETLRRGEILELQRSQVRGQEQEVMRAAGIVSSMQAPLRVRGQLRWALAYQCTTAVRRWSEAERDHLRAMGGALAVALDREESMLALDAEKEQLRVVLESLSDAVLTADRAGRIVLANPAASRLLGASPENLSGKPLGSYFEVRDPVPGDPSPPYPQGVGTDAVELVLRTGEPLHTPRHVWTIPREGPALHVSCSTLPLRDASGRLAGVLRVFHDLTAEDQRQAELIRAGKLDGLAVIAAGIAHDFNNILTALNGNVSFALASLSEGQTEDAIARLDDAELAGRRARELTGQLMTFTRGGHPLRQAASLREILRDCVNFALHGSNVRADWEIEDDLPDLEADPAQLHRVLHNIVLNAVQAMPGGGRLRVRARAEDHGSDDCQRPHVRIEAEDTGPGIPADVLPRVFEPFFSTKPGGSGLGLAAAHAIVKKHDGRIVCENAPGAGTLVRIWWPSAGRRSPADAERAQPPRAVRTGAKVLVLDDEPGVRVVARRMLEGLGHQVTEAASAAEAMELFRNARTAGKPFEVGLLDLTLPGGPGGIEVMQEARSEDPSLRCIVSSGYMVDEVRSDYLRLGFCALLAKPYQRNELAAVMEQALSGE